MTEHHDRIKKLYIRSGGALVAFIAFIVLNVNAILIGDEANNMGLLSIVPLVIAYFALPRRIPRIIGSDASGDSDLALKLDRLVRFINWLRLIFFVVAIFVLLVLPRIIPAPS